MNFLMIKVIFQINELVGSIIFTVSNSFIAKLKKKRVGRNSQEKLDRPTFKIVILDIQRTI